MADQVAHEAQKRAVSQSGGAITNPEPSSCAPRRTKSPQGAHGARWAPTPKQNPPHAKDGGQNDHETQPAFAPLIDVAGHPKNDTQPADARFVDPLIQQIVEQWRLRQDMVRAMSRLTLQAKAILRRICDGDKTEANRLYRSLSNGKDHELAGVARIAVAPLLMAREPLEITRKAIEKRLVIMAKELPIAHMVEETSGLGYPGLAAIVGECGDLSAYKSIAAVWKRCGLAVIDGGRQRKVAGEAAIEHGYSPSRRSVIWTITDSLFKAQSRSEGPYRALYDGWKVEELAKELTKGHAHNRAMRKVSKRLLRDLTVAWRADRATSVLKPRGIAPDPQRSLAPE